MWPWESILLNLQYQKERNNKKYCKERAVKWKSHNLSAKAGVWINGRRKSILSAISKLIFRLFYFFCLLKSIHVKYGPQNTTKYKRDAIFGVRWGSVRLFGVSGSLVKAVFPLSKWEITVLGQTLVSTNPAWPISMDDPIGQKNLQNKSNPTLDHKREEFVFACLIFRELIWLCCQCAKITWRRERVEVIPWSLRSSFKLASFK